MTIKSAPYYWVECDGEGCTARCPDGSWDGIDAYNSEESALDDVLDADWIVTEDGRHLCPDCAAREDLARRLQEEGE